MVNLWTVHSMIMYTCLRYIKKKMPNMCSHRYYSSFFSQKYKKTKININKTGDFFLAISSLNSIFFLNVRNCVYIHTVTSQLTTWWLEWYFFDELSIFCRDKYISELRRADIYVNKLKLDFSCYTIQTSAKIKLISRLKSVSSRR